MSFEHPLVLAGAPLALAWLFFAFRARRSARAVGARIEQRFAGARRLSARPPRRARLRGLLAAQGALLALGALAGPQWGSVRETRVERSREVLIALDVSRSMLATDVVPSRLERSKLLVRSLLDELRGEQVGLVLFAGTAFLQSPLSADHEVLRELLADLGPGSLPQGGTDYAAMLRASVEAFRPGGEGDRYLVVLSDGEAHDESWREGLPAVEQAGIRAIALGVGTPEGAVIPDARGGVVKDERGAAVLSRLEPGTLEALAQATGGTYRDAASWVDVAALIDATVAQGAAADYIEERGVRPQPRFQWLLAPALACWLLAFWCELPVRPVRRRLAATAAALAAALGLAASPDPALAATPAPAAAAAAPGALEATVAELAAKPALAAPDYVRLAEQTLAYGERAAGSASPALEGVVDDALLGVERGERESPETADWPELRRRLAALKEREEKKDSQHQPQPQDRQPQPSQPPQQHGAESRSSGANADTSPGGGSRGEAGEGAEPRDTDARRNAGEDASAAPRGGHASSSPGEEGRDEAGQGPRAEAEPKPIEDPAAGLGAQGGLAGEKEPSGAAVEAEPAGAEAKAPTRRVGGGGGIEAPDGSAPGLVEALGRQARIREGDAPSVLFQRMQRSEGRERPQSKGKNW